MQNFIDKIDEIQEQTKAIFDSLQNLRQEIGEKEFKENMLKSIELIKYLDTFDKKIEHLNNIIVYHKKIDSVTIYLELRGQLFCLKFCNELNNKSKLAKFHFGDVPINFETILDIEKRHLKEVL